MAADLAELVDPAHTVLVTVRTQRSQGWRSEGAI
jgi:hypothetical protein